MISTTPKGSGTIFADDGKVVIGAATYTKSKYY